MSGEASEPSKRPQSAWRRFSQPTLPRAGLPNLPTIPGFQSALLGYLGEVEAALRDKLASATGATGVPDHSNDIFWSDSTPVDTPSAGEDVNGIRNGDSSSTTATSVYSTNGTAGLRKRLAKINEYNDRTPSPPPTDSDPHTTLLHHLSSLREDVLAYLPSRASITSPVGPSAEWLRTLPSRLSLLDISIPIPNTQDLDIKGKTKALTSSAPSLPEFASVESARQKLITLVHALLPSEEWAGWEKLGWEETDPHIEGSSRGRPVGSMMRRATERVPRSTREALYFSDGDEDDIEDPEEEEPEYLFPNRTPASVRANTRKKRIRSKSLGMAASSSASWLGVGAGAPLQRILTAPADQSIPFDLDSPTAEKAELLEEEVPELQELLEDEGPTLAEALERAEGGNMMIGYQDLPFIWRNNEHIINGYRFIPLHASTGPIPLFKSAFWWSNETVNIHSHFVPTLFIICIIPFIIYNSPLPDANFLDTAVLVAYLLAAISCLSSSAGWHILSGCASRKWFEWGACVDYIGISWLIALTFETILYDAYYCHPKTILGYTFSNLAFASLGSYLPFQHWFNERRNKNWRISFFLGMCAAMFAPIVQLFFQYGWEKASGLMAPYTISVSMYVIGLIFYGFHFPECIWPGRFDFWGASHQIWHAGIVLAIILHYKAIFFGHSQRYIYSCEAVDARPIGDIAEAWWRGVWA